VHISIPFQYNCNIENNWSHDSPKFAFRFDGKPFKTKLFGINGTIKSTVIWNTNGVSIKGD
jgi:hypothetical protein